MTIVDHYSSRIRLLDHLIKGNRMQAEERAVERLNEIDAFQQLL